ncbi:MAG TPA: sulfurtransferase TusA family protein [Candidatus Polarisedimenticolia bacterium]|nr:sulfurtransferase TusA family protein [Candidatus Polarisedimenticolia bacterium]
MGPGSGGGRSWRGQESLRAPADLTADRIIDTVGLYCPIPIIRTAEAIAPMRTGEVLEVASDDRVILLDMPAWCESTGHAYLGFREAGVAGEWRLFVRRK